MKKLALALASLLLLGVAPATPVADDGCSQYLLGFPTCGDAAGTFTPPNSAAVVADYRLFDADTGTQATWPDVSGLGNDLTETTAANRPTTTGGLHPNGSGYGLVYDAVDDVMNEGGAARSNDYRALAVGWNQTAVATQRIASGPDAAGILWISTSTLRWRSSGGTDRDIAAGFTTGHHYLLIYEDFVNNTLEIWLDGSKVVDRSDHTMTPTSITMYVAQNLPGSRTMYQVISWDSATPLTWSAGDLTDLWAYLDAS